MLGRCSSLELVEGCISTGALDENSELPATEIAGCVVLRRHPLVLAASSQAIDNVASLPITNLSRMGIRLQGRDLPSADQEVLITTGTFAVFANVSRSCSGECELTFIPPLDGEQLSQFEQEGKWATVMGIV